MNASCGGGLSWLRSRWRCDGGCLAGDGPLLPESDVNRSDTRVPSLFFISRAAKASLEICGLAWSQVPGRAREACTQLSRLASRQMSFPCKAYYSFHCKLWSDYDDSQFEEEDASIEMILQAAKSPKQ